MENEMSTAQKIWDRVVEFCVNYSFEVVGAIVVLVIGFAIGNWCAHLVLKLCERKKLDITLSKFCASVAKITVLAFAIVIALGKFGITISPLIAAISAAAFGASFAIQGPLSNYGAGLSIIISRPFVIGDTITVAGVSGVVHEVKLACTILTDEDGVRITIPNKHIVGEIIHNSKQYKIVESVVGISYSDDAEKAISTIRQTLGRFNEVAKEPQVQIGIQQFADSSVNIGLRYWIPTAKYFQLSYEINLAIFHALEKAGIRIPFPQREVRLISQPPAATGVR